MERNSWVDSRPSRIENGGHRGVYGPEIPCSDEVREAPEPGLGIPARARLIAESRRRPGCYAGTRCRTSSMTGIGSGA